MTSFERNWMAKKIAKLNQVFSIAEISWQKIEIEFC